MPLRIQAAVDVPLLVHFQTSLRPRPALVLNRAWDIRRAM